MARAAGALDVLVLSGETTAPEAAHAAPSLVVRDVGELGDRLAAARATTPSAPRPEPQTPRIP